jgi:acyl-CoA reductase-like NAD-dependent aldehyde dehydrogenase
MPSSFPGALGALGALISGEHCDRVMGYMEIAKKAGGKFLAGGGRKVSGGS